MLKRKKRGGGQNKMQKMTSTQFPSNLTVVKKGVFCDPFRKKCFSFLSVYMCVCVCVYLYIYTIGVWYDYNQGFPHGSGGKESACNGGDQSSIPGLGRFPGQGNGNPLQYSCPENSMNGGAWWVTKSLDPAE